MLIWLDNNLGARQQGPKPQRALHSPYTLMWRWIAVTTEAGDRLLEIKITGIIGSKQLMTGHFVELRQSRRNLTW